MAANIIDTLAVICEIAAATCAQGAQLGLSPRSQKISGLFQDRSECLGEHQNSPTIECCYQWQNGRGRCANRRVRSRYSKRAPVSSRALLLAYSIVWGRGYDCWEVGYSGWGTLESMPGPDLRDKEHWRSVYSGIAHSKVCRY